VYIEEILVTRIQGQSQTLDILLGAFLKFITVSEICATAKAPS